MIEEGTGHYFVPASVKAVVLRGDEVLLCLNPRNEWELPGGWPDRADKSHTDTLVREVREECGLRVEPGRLLLAELLHVGPRHKVMVVAYAASCRTADEPLPGSEHAAVRFFPAGDLPDNLPDLYRRAIRAAAGTVEEARVDG